MSTIHNIDGDLAAATTTLQPTDMIPVYVAGAGQSKKMSGLLLGAGTTGVVVTTATSLSLTATQHANKLLVVNTNSTVANTFTLPAATGSGNRYHILNGIAQTQGSIVITRAGSDVLKGRALSFDSSAVATHANIFVTLTATAITWNRTTTGGIGHDDVILFDDAAGSWRVFVTNHTSGDDATPFS